MTQSVCKVPDCCLQCPAGLEGMSIALTDAQAAAGSGSG